MRCSRERREEGPGCKQLEADEQRERGSEEEKRINETRTSLRRVVVAVLSQDMTVVPISR